MFLKLSEPESDNKFCFANEWVRNRDMRSIPGIKKCNWLVLGDFVRTAVAM